MEKTLKVNINYKKDLIVNTIAQILYLFALWVMTIITPRLGNSSDAGVFTLALSVSNICTAIATFSINFYIASDVKHRFKDIHYFYFGLTSTLLSLLVSFIVCLSFGYHLDLPVFWGIILYYIFKCAENVTIITTASVQRAGKLYKAGYALMVKAILSLAIFTLTLYLSKNLMLSFGIIAAFAFIYFFFVDFRIFRKYTTESYKISKDIYLNALKLFGFAFPVFAYGFCFATIVSFPRMVLDQFFSKEVVGYFGTMAAISTLIQSGLSAILIPFLPKLATLYNEGKKKDLYILLLKFSLFIACATLAAFACACFLDKWLLGILYPTDTEVLKYAHFFKWIIAATGIQAFVILACLSLISFRDLYYLILASGIGLSVMFLLSNVLIYSRGIQGIILTYMLGYGSMFVASGIKVIYLIQNSNKKLMIKSSNNKNINDINGNNSKKKIKMTREEKDKITERMCGLEEFHKDCLKILLYVDKLARKNNIKYSTSSGTMLGQIRHKGFIPWDDDVDIYLTRDNFNKLIDAIRKDTNDSFKLLTPNSYGNDFVDLIYRIVYVKKSYKNASNFGMYEDLTHPWIDIFALDKAPIGKFNFKIHCAKIKLLYALLCSRKKIKLGIKMNIIYKVGLLVFKVIGRLFKQKYLLQKLDKEAMKYNKYQSLKNYHYTYSMIDIDTLIREEYIKDTIYLEFEGKQIQCFKGYKQILKDEYHDYMTPRIDSTKFIRHFELSKCSDQEIADFYMNN